MISSKRAERTQRTFDCRAKNGCTICDFKMTGKSVKSGEVDSLKEELQDLKEIVKGLTARVSVLESEKENLKHELKKVQDARNVNVKKFVEEAVQKDSYVEKLKQNLTTKPGQVVKCVADLQDRRFNLVFRGIEESNKTDSEEKKAHDEVQVKKVADKAGLPKKFAQSILSIRRLGRKEEGKNHRPILVRLSSQDLREQALRCNKDLREYNKANSEKGSATRYKIDPDLTKEQLDILDKMWKEAKSKSKNGKRFFVVGKEQPILKYVQEEENQ